MTWLPFRQPWLNRVLLLVYAAAFFALYMWVLGLGGPYEGYE